MQANTVFGALRGLEVSIEFAPYSKNLILENKTEQLWTKHMT